MNYQTDFLHEKIIQIRELNIMKTLNWTVLSIFSILSIGLFACNNDEPEVITEEEYVPVKGEVILGDTTVMATIEFSDSTITRILTSTKWEASSFARNIYDNGVFKSCDVAVYAARSLSIPIIECEFFINGEFTIRRYNFLSYNVQYYGDWTVKNGVLTLSFANNENCRDVIMVGVDDEQIICDTKYFKGSHLSFIDVSWANLETAMVRYNWTPVK